MGAGCSFQALASVRSRTDELPATYTEERLTPQGRRFGGFPGAGLTKDL